MPHPESEHGLRVQLATALRERDEARTDAANLRFANDKARATTEKLWLERDELRAVAVNANKQTADVNALRLKQDEELVALRAQVQAWKDGVCQDCVEKDEAIAAARRECDGPRGLYGRCRVMVPTHIIEGRDYESQMCCNSLPCALHPTALGAPAAAAGEEGTR